MTNTKIKTAPWSAVRKRAVKPGDEPLIAAEREILEAELRLAALRKHRKASQTTIAKRLSVSQSILSSSNAAPIRDCRRSRATSTRSAGNSSSLVVFDDERILI